MDNQKTKQKQKLPDANVHSGHRARMRQRLTNGDLDSYQTHEIVEMMLYQAHKTKDTNAIAHALLKKFGSLTGIIHPLKRSHPLHKDARDWLVTSFFMRLDAEK